MTSRIPQCEVFWSSKSSSELSGVPEDSNPNFFQVLGFTPTLGQSRVATITIAIAQVHARHSSSFFISCYQPFSPLFSFSILLLHLLSSWSQFSQIIFLSFF
jgi:hypothetical protein